MDIEINVSEANTKANTKANNDNKQIEIDKIKFQKMVFLYNALENEWKLKKIGNKYFCSKRHKGDKHVYQAGYLKDFLLDNFTLE
jgi:hypothetical protein